MKDLVDYIVKSFIGEESYEIVLVEDGDKVDIRVMVDKDKISKVIQGTLYCNWDKPYP